MTKQIKKLNQQFESWLIDAGLTQRKLAKQLGIDPSALSHIKLGSREIKALEARNMARAFGVSTDQVIDHFEAVRMFT